MNSACFEWSIFVQIYDLSSSIYIGVASPGVMHFLWLRSLLVMVYMGEDQAHPGACQHPDSSRGVK